MQGMWQQVLIKALLQLQLALQLLPPRYWAVLRSLRAGLPVWRLAELAEMEQGQRQQQRRQQQQQRQQQRQQQEQTAEPAAALSPSGTPPS